MFESRLKTPYVLLFYVGLAVVFFYRLYGVGFTADFTGWLICHENQTAFREIHKCFSIQGLYYVPFLFLKIMTDLFGLNALPWYLLFTVFHGLNAWLVYYATLKLQDLYSSGRPSQWVAFGAGLLFLFNPYQVEVVAWKACINHLTECASLLGTLILFIKYLKTNKNRYLYISVALFVLSVFNVEYFLILPVVLAALLLTYKSEWPGFNKFKTLLPFLGVLLIYFGLNAIILDRVVGHYDLDRSQITMAGIASVELKYLFKVLPFGRFWPFRVQQEIYGLMSTQPAGWSALLVAVGVVVWFTLKRASLGGVPRLSVFSAFSFFVLLIPVTPLYFYYILYGENDRHTYIPLAFFAIALAVLLLATRHWIPRMLFLIWLALSVVFSYRMTRYWDTADEVLDLLVDEFTWDDASEVYILNMPDNYKGVWVARNLDGDSALREVLTLVEGRSPGSIYEIYQYNLTDPEDGVTAERSGENQVTVTFDQWGNWWWRDGIGGADHQHEKYSTKIRGQSYILTLNDPAPGAVVIYFDGTTWRKVNM